MRKFFLIGFVFLILISSVHGFNSDIIGYFSFNNHYLDSSDNVILYPYVTPKYVDGVLNDTINFSGNYLYGNESNYNFEWNDSFSVSFWLKYNDSGVIFVSKQRATVVYDGWVLYDGNSGKLCPRLVHNYSAGEWIALCGDKNIKNNKWQYITFTYDGSGKASGIKLYLNGSLMTNSVSADNLKNKTIKTDVNFQVNGRDGYNTYVMQDGYIDELSIWDGVLSQNEILQLYNNGQGFNPYDILISINEPQENNSYNNLTINFNATSYIDLNNSVINVTKNNISYYIETISEINDTNFTYNKTISLNESGYYNLKVEVDNKEFSEQDNKNFYYDDTEPTIYIYDAKATYNNSAIVINGYVIDDYMGVNRTLIDDVHNFTNTGNATNFSFFNNNDFENGDYCINITSYDNLENKKDYEYCFTIFKSVGEKQAGYIYTSDIINYNNRRGVIDFYIPNYPYEKINDVINFGFRVRSPDYKKVIFDDLNINLSILNDTFNTIFNYVTNNYEVDLIFNDSDKGYRNFTVLTDDTEHINDRQGQIYISDFVNVTGQIWTDDNKTEKLNYDNAYIYFIPHYEGSDIQNFQGVVIFFNAINQQAEKLISKILDDDIAFMSSDEWVNYRKKGFYQKLNDGYFELEVPINQSYNIRLLIFEENSNIIESTYYYDYLLYKNLNYDVSLSDKLYINQSKYIQYIVKPTELNPIFHYVYYILWIIGIVILFGLVFGMWKLTNDPMFVAKTFLISLSILLVILQLIKLIWG